MESWERKASRGARWTEEDGRSAVAEWRASGKPLDAFARRHGLRPQRLAWWRDRLEASRPALVPVTVRAAATTTPAAVLCVGELRVEVADVSQLSPAWIAALAAALRETEPCC